MFKIKTRILAVVLAVFMVLSLPVTPAFATDTMMSISDAVSDSSVKKIYFKLKTDKDLASYAVNEEITFTATLWGDGDGDGNTENDIQLSAPYFKYTLEYDDGTASKTDYAAADTGVATIKAKLTKAGAVRISLSPADSSKNQISNSKINTYCGGAIAGASDIQVTTAEPADFDNFWKGQLAQLDAVSPDIEYIADVSDKFNKSGYKFYEIHIKCVEANVKTLSEDSYVSVFLSLPENANPGSLKLTVSFEGYGVYDPVSPGAGTNNARMMVYAHSLPLDKESGWYLNHFRECYPEYLHSSTKHNGYGWDYENDIEDNTDPEKVYFRDMLLRDLQAIRFFAKAFGDAGVSNTVNDIDTSAWKGLWDGNALTVTGGSQGGFRTIAAGALDALSGENSVGIADLRASVPWFADVADSTAEGKIQSSFHPEYKAGLAYYDTALLAKRVDVDIVVIGAGTGDNLCPMSGVQAIFNNLKVEDATLKFIQGKAHDASHSSGVGYADSAQNKLGAYSGTFNSGGLNNWEFNPETGVFTISNELKSGWVTVPSCAESGAWGTSIRDLVKSVVMKGRFSKINSMAFEGYPLLESITLPKGMRVQFDSSSFAHCPNLTEIKVEGDAYIPGAVDLSNAVSSASGGHPVNTLADKKNVFSGSTSVKTIILNDFYKDEEWYRLNKDTLPVNLTTIMGPANSEYLRAFCEANGYNFVPYGKIGTGTAWTYDEATKTVTIYGDGTGSALGVLSATDVEILKDAEKLVIRGDIASIADKAFAGLTGLKTVIMRGNAPTAPANAKPFGENDVEILVNEDAAAGFGKTWCGYKVSIFDPGDVNCDGEINAVDAVLLAQYIANWDVAVDDYSADCNGDGKIDATDAVLLAQYLAGWDVTLGGETPPTTDPDPTPVDGEDNEVDAGDVFQ